MVKDDAPYADNMTSISTEISGYVKGIFNVRVMDHHDKDCVN